MPYNIIKNHYSQMCGDWDKQDTLSASHAICYKKCNFNCVFCVNNDHPSKIYNDIEYDQFVYLISELQKSGNYFKFSGGEPTLNNRLMQDINIVKQLGGYVFLDTNGSRPNIVSELISNELIDVLGISLKGLTKEKAMEAAAIKNGRLCWENVFETIKIGAQTSNVRVIITYVFHNEENIIDLEQFARLISPFPDVYLKINNLLYTSHHKKGLKAIEIKKFQHMAERFVEKFPIWKNRMIIVNSEEAISQYEKIVFL